MVRSQSPLLEEGDGHEDDAMAIPVPSGMLDTYMYRYNVAIDALVATGFWEDIQPGYICWMRSGSGVLRCLASTERVFWLLGVGFAALVPFFGVFVATNVGGLAEVGAKEGAMWAVLGGMVLEVGLFLFHLMAASTVASNERVVHWDESVALAMVREEEAGSEGARLVPVSEHVVGAAIAGGSRRGGGGSTRGSFLSIQHRASTEDGRRPSLPSERSATYPSQPDPQARIHTLPLDPTQPPPPPSSHSLHSSFSTAITQSPSAAPMFVLLYSAEWKKRMYDRPKRFYTLLLVLHVATIAGIAAVAYTWKFSFQKLKV